MPHAPILVSPVGGSRIGAAAASCHAMREAASRVMRLKPEDIVLISPHSPRKRGAFGLWSADFIAGSFDEFGAPEATVALPNDRPLVDAIVEAAHSRNLATWFIPGHHLDHGALVPLWFLGEAGWSGPTVVVSLSNSGEEALARLGEAIAAAAETLHRRVAVIASGDMSHRLTAGAPCGFHPRAHQFDETFIRLVRAGDYHTLSEINPELRELAAEDAVDSTVVAAAAARWNSSGHEVLNYERPFGVGYGVAVLSAPQCGLNKPASPDSDALYHCGDVLPWVARQSVAAALHSDHGSSPKVAGDYLNTPRGVFVTIHQRNGKLRGCVGTLTPVCANLVGETWHNARLAAFRDGRFAPVTADELNHLQFDVSVVRPSEEVASRTKLDPERYGVIVRTPDGRCGVLLPAIKSVTTVEEQLAIALRKGGIGQDEPFATERFTVDHFEEHF